MLAAFWLVAGGEAFCGDAKPAQKKAHAPKKTTGSSTKRTAARKAPSKSRRSTRPTPFRYRLARLRIDPERAAEIQRALIDAGYLRQEANGKWDDATRDATRRFQADHGFPTTGLPEAKTLMKLGLGPHPLPPEVDPSLQPHASVGSPPVPTATESPDGSPAYDQE